MSVLSVKGITCLLSFTRRYLQLSTCFAAKFVVNCTFTAHLNDGPLAFKLNFCVLYLLLC